MYKCRVEKRILQSILDHNHYTSLQYELVVDVAPERGGVLQDGQWYSGPLTKVIWATDDECFYCRVKDEFPFMQGCDDYSHDWIVETYQREGWLLSADRIDRTE